MSFAHGLIEVAHEALDDLDRSQTIEHLRHLLVDCGLLPDRDPGLARYDRWVRERLDATVDNTGDARLLHQYVTWHQRKRLVESSIKGRLRSAQLNGSTQTLRVAAQFLNWLRSRGRSISTCRQSDLDEWLATPPSTRVRVRGFVRWAKDTKRMPALQMVKESKPNLEVLDQDQRLAVIARLVAPNGQHCASQCIGLLLALYAQPLSRIVTLTVNSLVDVDAELSIILGTNAAPLPAPFDRPFRELLESPWQRNTHNHQSPWLFPGTRAGTHMSAASAHKAVARIAKPLLEMRHAALRQLVMDCPPPVVADMIGYTHHGTTNHATRAGSPWLTDAAHHRADARSDRRATPEAHE